MSLSVKIMDEMKTAMKAKDTVALEALRAIKSELLLAQTSSGSKEEISEDEEIKLLQRLVKTRKESARIFTVPAGSSEMPCRNTSARVPREMHPQRAR